MIEKIFNEYVDAVCTTLDRINKILELANAHIGYRVRDEIVFYMLCNRETSFLEEGVAFDHQILPRIQSSSDSVRGML